MNYFEIAQILGALFAVVHPPLKGVGELVFGDSSGAPSTAHLEAVLGQEPPALSAFSLGQRKMSARTISGE
jgi:hypothetical protein